MLEKISPNEGVCQGFTKKSGQDVESFDGSPLQLLTNALVPSVTAFGTGKAKLYYYGRLSPDNKEAIMNRQAEIH